MTEKLFQTASLGFYPRPSWFNLSLGKRDFKAAMNDSLFRDQYTDAQTIVVHDQEYAGLDIVSDGCLRNDMQVGGRGWFYYLVDRLAGYRETTDTTGAWAIRYGEGHILHEVIEAYQPPIFSGKVELAVPLRFGSMWKLAQMQTSRPVKFNAIATSNIGEMSWNRYYKSKNDLIRDLSSIVNKEYRELVKAGCKILQIDQPRTHFVANEWKPKPEQFEVEKEAFNADVKDVDAEIWVHTCWGSAYQQRGVDLNAVSYEKAIPHLLELDANVITFECASTGGKDLKFLKEYPSAKRIGVGVIDHLSGQVETPHQVAKLIREAAKYVDPGRIIVTSDCGFEREGFDRRIALYKIRSMVEGARIVRQEYERKA